MVSRDFVSAFIFMVCNRICSEELRTKKKYFLNLCYIYSLASNLISSGSCSHLFDSNAFSVKSFITKCGETRAKS